MSEILVSMEGIDKSFPGVHALDQARFELQAGEVHALIGENGAGKSTLMKILAGIYHKDAGRIVYRGSEVNIPNPRAAQHLGISMIHQEINLVPHLTLAQNVFIGREPRASLPFMLKENEINAQTQALFDSMRLKLDPRTRASDLTVAKQQMVEIAKALSFNSQVLIMDEPTAALGVPEQRKVHELVRTLKSQGVPVIIISHNMQDIFASADRIIVMRRGSKVGDVLAKDTDGERLVGLMVGAGEA